MNASPPLPTILGLTSAEITSLFEHEVLQRVSDRLGSGPTVSSSDTGQAAHHVIMRPTDTQRVQSSVAPDSRRSLIDHDVA